MLHDKWASRSEILVFCFNFRPFHSRRIILCYLAESFLLKSHYMTYLNKNSKEKSYFRTCLRSSTLSLSLTTLTVTTFIDFEIWITAWPTALLAPFWMIWSKVGKKIRIRNLRLFCSTLWLVCNNSNFNFNNFKKLQRRSESEIWFIHLFVVLNC